MRLGIEEKNLNKTSDSSLEISGKKNLQKIPNGPGIIICLLLHTISLTHKPYLTNYSP